MSDHEYAPGLPIAGVDGCKRGWLCVLRDTDGNVTSSCFDTAEALLAQSPRPAVLTIDIPIGLPDVGPLTCDVEARVFVGPRRSSVFPAPIRPVLTASSWQEACTIRHGIEGKRDERP